jgi:Ca2+-binding RTX toxin-like protein
MYQSHLLASAGHLDSFVFGGPVSTAVGMDETPAHREIIKLGGGDNTFTFDNADDVTVYAGDGNDTVIRQGVGNDVIKGGTGNDFLINDAGGEVIMIGGAGSNILSSYAGHAIMHGGTDANISSAMIAGGGTVDMYANPNAADWFIFNGGQPAFHDSIHGASASDHVDLSGLGYVDGSGDYHELTLGQLSVHGNALWIDENGRTDVIDGIGHLITDMGGLQAAEDAGFLKLDQKGAEFHPDWFM